MSERPVELVLDDDLSRSRADLVIFDCDGVLVDSEVISNGVLADMLCEEGLATTLSEARRDYQGLLLGEVVRSAQKRLGRPLPEGWLARYENRRADVFRRELEPVANAGTVVAQITLAGITVCVASQGKLEKTELSLQLTGLEALFAEGAVFSAAMVERGKPHPDLFLHAARVMGAEPARCVVVEDTPSGATAAVAAGMRALGYAADSDADALAGAGAEVFMSLSELPGMLGIS